MTATTYTMRNLNSQVGRRVTVRAAAGMPWATEYNVAPWDTWRPMNDGIPEGEYVIAEMTPESNEDGAEVFYVLQAA